MAKKIDIHIDDLAANDFCDAMKNKLWQKRQRGKRGWWIPEECSIERLWEMLREHISKGDPLDIANFAMMIWQREEWMRHPDHKPDISIETDEEHEGYVKAYPTKG